MWCLLAAVLTSLIAIPTAGTDALVKCLPLGTLVLFVVGLVTRRWRTGFQPRDLSPIAATLGFLLTASVTAGLMGLPFAISDARSADSLDATAGRIQGLFTNPNTLGLMGLLLCPVAVGLYIETKKRSNLLWALSGILAVLLSESRTSLAALAIAAVVIAGLPVLRKGLFQVQAWVLLVPVALVLLFAYGRAILPESLARVFSRFSPDTSARSRFNGREELWSTAIQAWSESPLVGHGYGQSGIVMDRYRQMGAFDIQSASTHQSFLQWGIETGWLGFVGLAVAIFGVISGALRKDHSPSAMGAAVAALAGVASMFMESVVFATGSAFPWVYWALAAAVVAGPRIRAEHSAASS
ncbi:hypothetical protein BJF82_03260 [Kytococcus sp. CUA-901]|nr:hypothetical protein BJF82_03260 [Kytococcus sp. CUA-901]